MITYKPFQKLLIDRDLMKKDVIAMAGISNATMAKLGSNDYVSLEIIDRLCRALDCQPGDILEYVPDKDTSSANDGLLR